MKVSTKGRYGLTIMIELARNYGAGPTSLKSIAARHSLSEHYLEQLIAPLRNAGLVKSIRGAYGGYTLSREPDQITASDVITVLEGPISAVDYDEEDPAKLHLWERVCESIINVLESTTLSDLTSFQDDNNKDYFMFHI